ncbi:AI-2E family transporter, partial [Clostridium botulinum]|nr:AI-2E family transporter [Clostridium botulinum]
MLLRAYIIKSNFKVVYTIFETYKKIISLTILLCVT